MWSKTYSNAGREVLEMSACILAQSELEMLQSLGIIRRAVPLRLHPL